jgi:hypothetical protein
MQAVEVLVVVAHGVDLRLHVAQFVDGLHLAGDRAPAPLNCRPTRAKP